MFYTRVTGICNFYVIWKKKTDLADRGGTILYLGGLWGNHTVFGGNF